jgi:hypothetical protein
LNRLITEWAGSRSNITRILPYHEPYGAASL